MNIFFDRFYSTYFDYMPVEGIQRVKTFHILDELIQWYGNYQSFHIQHLDNQDIFDKIEELEELEYKYTNNLLNCKCHENESYDEFSQKIEDAIKTIRQSVEFKKDFLKRCID